LAAVENIPINGKVVKKDSVKSNPNFSPKKVYLLNNKRRSHREFDDESIGTDISRKYVDLFNDDNIEKTQIGKNFPKIQDTSKKMNFTLMGLKMFKKYLKNIYHGEKTGKTSVVVTRTFYSNLNMVL
jgi:hypothetical protein